MKSTRRHELQTNQLADRLGHWIEAARPYGTTILLVGGGAILILFAAYFLVSSKEKSVEAGWQSYLLAGVNSAGGDVVEDLDNVTDQFAGSQAGQWAALTAADIRAARGVEKLFTDRAAAETDLNSAKTHYREVIDSKWAASEPLMMHRAQYGLAQVLEAQGELDEAAKNLRASRRSGRHEPVGEDGQGATGTVGPDRHEEMVQLVRQPEADPSRSRHRRGGPQATRDRNGLEFVAGNPES